MKKIPAIITAVILFTALSFTSAQAQNRAYYYYPSHNMYYDVSGKQFVFNNGTTWARTKTVPSGVTLVKTTPRVTVYHAGEDVWKDNRGHSMKYKDMKTQPQMKQKPKANGFKPKLKGKS